MHYFKPTAVLCTFEGVFWGQFMVIFMVIMVSYCNKFPGNSFRAKGMNIHPYLFLKHA